MADKAKAIRGLEACALDLRSVHCANCPYLTDDADDASCITTLMRDALILLKEQREGSVPIKSTTVQKEFADRVGLVVPDFWCGACHFNLVGHPKFCPNCGKKVKWDD